MSENRILIPVSAIFSDKIAAGRPQHKPEKVPRSNHISNNRAKDSPAQNISQHTPHLRRCLIYHMQRQKTMLMPQSKKSRSYRIVRTILLGREISLDASLR